MTLHEDGGAALRNGILGPGLALSRPQVSAKLANQLATLDESWKRDRAVSA